MSNFGPDVLDKSVLEVVRHLAVSSPDQASEIQHFGQILHDEATHLEYGVFSVAPSRYGKSVQYYPRLPKIISAFAMSNFELAEENDFPPLTPQRAIKLARFQEETAGYMSTETKSRVDPDILKTSAIGLVGLQAAILGNPENLRQDEAVDLRRLTAATYVHKFVLPISERYQMNKRRAR